MSQLNDDHEENCDVCKISKLFQEIKTVAPQFSERIDYAGNVWEEESNDLCIANTKLDLLHKLCQTHSLSVLMEIQAVFDKHGHLYPPE